MMLILIAKRTIPLKDVIILEMLQKIIFTRTCKNESEVYNVSVGIIFFIFGPANTRVRKSTLFADIRPAPASAP
jgi:hypothetical protein